jgi:hypothetical protein
MFLSGSGELRRKCGCSGSMLSCIYIHIEMSGVEYEKLIMERFFVMISFAQRLCVKLLSANLDAGKAV